MVSEPSGYPTRCEGALSALRDPPGPGDDVPQPGLPEPPEAQSLPLQRRSWWQGLPSGTRQPRHVALALAHPVDLPRQVVVLLGLADPLHADRAGSAGAALVARADDGEQLLDTG